MNFVDDFKLETDNITFYIRSKLINVNYHAINSCRLVKEPFYKRPFVAGFIGALLMLIMFPFLLEMVNATSVSIPSNRYAGTINMAEVIIFIFGFILLILSFKQDLYMLIQTDEDIYKVSVKNKIKEISRLEFEEGFKNKTGHQIIK